MTDAEKIAERLANATFRSVADDLVRTEDVWCDRVATALLDTGLREAVDFIAYVAESPAKEHGGFSEAHVYNAKHALSALLGEPSDLERGLIDGLTEIRDTFKGDQPP